MTTGAGQRTGRQGRARAVGDAAVLVEVDGSDTARAVAAAAREAGRPGVTDVVGGMRTVLVAVDPWAEEGLGAVGTGELGAWLERLADLGTDDAAAPVPRKVVLPVRFGGPDTEDVCRLAGVGPAELAELLGTTELRVAAVGFSPGFAYLDGLPAELAGVGRLDRPRPVVPAGSVAVAGGLAAVYPHPTPGGWRLVGRTAARLFDPTAPPFALLRPGDRVRFRTVREPTGDEPPPGGSDEMAPDPDRARPVVPASTQPRPALQPPPGARPALVVEHPGFLTLVQDTGRPALTAIGVPLAGPADPLAHRLANLLVGNDPGGGTLEVLVSGPVLRAECDLHVAVVGDAEVRVDGRHTRTGHVVPVAAGQHLSIGAVTQGARAYLAVAGGIEVPPVLGSRSTDVLTWLGPGALRAGDRLGRGTGRAGPPGDHLRPTAVAELRRAVGWETGGPGRPAGGFHRVLRVVAGPHPEWFGPGLLDELAARHYRVGPASDRVGLRLGPAEPPPRGRPHDEALARRPGELASQPMVTGAVQVPPDGLPVVLGPDHATLGGYPVAAVVIAADRWVLGQCRPGDTMAFQPVDGEEAAAALARLRRMVGGAVVGTYPVTAG